MFEVAEPVQYVAAAAAPVLVFLACFAAVRAGGKGLSDSDARNVRHGAWLFALLALAVLAVAAGGEHVPALLVAALAVVGLAAGIAVGRRSASSDA